MILTLCVFCFEINAQMPLPLKRFLEKPFLKGASISFMTKEIANKNVLYSYDPDRELIPASVMKTVTTAVALEVLGEDFRFETSVSYDGIIEKGVLNGNIYIYGSGDPTINSSKLKVKKDSIFTLWASAIKEAGIQKINGKIIADESIFDTEGVSMKWLREDLGSDYGQGSYGVNIFDNQYTLYIKTGATDTKPSIVRSSPSMLSLSFHNYLRTTTTLKDSFYIIGAPYANERYLYGVLPAYRNSIEIAGDIPDPALYLAQYFTNYLSINEGIHVEKEASCHRLLSETNEWKITQQKRLIVTYSPPLAEIIQITNFTSHNMYADVLIKTLGLNYQTNSTEIISSFEKGVKVIKNHLEKNGINTTSLWMYDGSGLAITNKVSADFLCDLYIHMNQSTVSDVYIQSIPQPGMNGTVRNMLKNTFLQEKTRLKSGSMSRVSCYGGYIEKDGKVYAIALLINNFSGKNAQMRKAVEELLLSLFK